MPKIYTHFLNKNIVLFHKYYNNKEVKYLDRLVNYNRRERDEIFF